MASKLVGKKGSWFTWEKWKKKENLGLINLMEKLPVMEDENGGLSIPKGSIPTVGQKNKTTNDYEG